MLPQPAQCGQRGDQIADVIQLNRKDALDFVVAEQRLAGADQPRRLSIGAVFVGQLGQPGAEVGIACRVERPPLLGEVACIEYVGDIRTARELMVDQLGMRRIDNRQTRLPGSQTEIYIVVDYRMRLIEPAESVKHVAAHQHAGAGDGCDVPLGQGQPEVAGIVLGQEPEGMAACSERGQEYPGMLDLAIGIEQLRRRQRQPPAVGHAPARHPASPPRWISISSFRNSRYCPVVCRAARLLKRDQLNASGIATTLSARLRISFLYFGRFDGILSMQMISKLR